MPSKIILTRDTIRQICRSYKNGQSAQNIATANNLTLKVVYSTLKREGIERRKPVVYNRQRFDQTPKSYYIKEKFSPQEKELFIAGLMLYYGEGAKTGNTIDFANSDPKLLKAFLSFLRVICTIDESKLRFYLYCFSDQDASQLISFWGKYLCVSKTQFTKPYVRPAIRSGKRKMVYGLLHIRYSDKRLLQEVLKKGENLLYSLYNLK
ncbi:MAG: hypothetical protein KIH67_004445 [Candidatus Moranbacteria bacterium]|nr:hypothetical protein [Candidatus Moranbacteria bacterium]